MIPDEMVRLGVGPVLQNGPFGRAVATAISEHNHAAVVQDEGAYLRVMAPRRCVVSRVLVEAALGAPVQFPGDLEVVLSSFTGRMSLTEDEAVWWIGSEPRS